jgi:hypothetical protein
MVLQNIGILPQHYMMSQPRRPQVEFISQTDLAKERERYEGKLTVCFTAESPICPVSAKIGKSMV